jgi:hypothetical protein
MNTKSLIALTFGCVMLAAPCLFAAPQDQDSVADAARKAQAQKQTAPKAKLVIDNDNLGTLTGTINVVGQEPAPADDQKKEKVADDKTQSAPASGNKATVKDESYWRQKFADANKKLADDSHELDILQREYNLKQEQFYTDPMASLKQDYSRQDLNDTKAKIDDKTNTVAQDKDEIANLEDELRQSGGDPGWATAPSQSSTSEEGSPSAPPAPAAPAAPAQ